MSADLSAADASHDRHHFRKSHEAAFDPQSDLGTLTECDRWRHGQAQDQGAFLECWCEFRPQLREDDRTYNQQRDRQRN